VEFPAHFRSVSTRNRIVGSKMLLLMRCRWYESSIPTQTRTKRTAASANQRNVLAEHQDCVPCRFSRYLPSPSHSETGRAGLPLRSNCSIAPSLCFDRHGIGQQGKQHLVDGSTHRLHLICVPVPPLILSSRKASIFSLCQGGGQLHWILPSCAMGRVSILISDWSKEAAYFW
jgi:hypothetical protein